MNNNFDKSNTTGNETNTDTNQMHICMEIAAAESIENLGYKTPKAN